MAEEEEPPVPGPNGLPKKKREEVSNELQEYWKDVMKNMRDLSDEEKIKLLQQEYQSAYNDIKCVNKELDSLEREILQYKSRGTTERNQKGPSCSQETNMDMTVSRLIISEVFDTDYTEVDAEQTIRYLAEFLSDTDDETDSDGSVPHLEVSAPESGSVENLDSTLMDVQAASSSNTSIKETRSMPITKKDHESISHEGSLKEPQSSDDLHEDFSLGDLPLYKPIAVTDVSTQGGHTTLVKESEARTDIWEPSSPNQEEQAITTQSGSFTETIDLKESEGKTDIKKE